MRIGFIGLGAMGYPMAKRLLDAGHELTVMNRSPAKVTAFEAMGAKGARTPAEVAENCEILFTCLLMPDHVEAAYLGPDGALSAGRPDHIFCDTSTVDPIRTRKIAAPVEAKGIPYFDAPISGGPGGAGKGTLSVMVGGPDSAFERLRSALLAFADPEKIFHLGPTGAGSTVKICNQMIVGVTHALLAEVFVLGQKAGIGPKTLYKVLNASSGRSNVLGRIYPIIEPRDFSPRFVLDGTIKDLECGISTGKALGVRTMMAATAQQLFLEASGLGHGMDDTAAIMLPMEKIAGVEVRED